MSFTEDPIQLTITGPDYNYLSFVDLPGIIHNLEKGTEDEIQAVLDMVERYIESENTLILVVRKAVDGVENCTSLNLAKKHDPEGKRTFEVITKCDAFGEDAERRSIKEYILNGY